MAPSDDGSGGAPYVGDLAIDGDTISAIVSYGESSANAGLHGVVEIDVAGMAVSPGFINMLSWATESLLEDGRAQSDIRQGVTLEVFGEGWSMGPLNDAMKAEMLEDQGDIKFDVAWTTLGEYLEHLESGASRRTWPRSSARRRCGFTSSGYEDRPPTRRGARADADLVRAAMEEGAARRRHRR